MLDQPSSRCPGLLASVRNYEEARIALQVGVDILDLKDPHKGSLGALEESVLISICQQVHGDCLLSATIGDLPPDAERIAQQVKAWLQLGSLDFIKIGLFDQRYFESCLGALKSLSSSGKLIAVVFADRLADSQGPIQVLAHSGFTGVMLDTADKTQGSLRQLWDDQQIKDFVAQAHAHGLLCGVAGSLGIEDIAPLCKIQPHYLGFRTALCSGQQRTQGLSAQATIQIRQEMEKNIATTAQTKP